MRGDIQAKEVYADRQLQERLGYGMLDVPFETHDGSFGVGFEDVINYAYVEAPDKDPKFYRRKIYDVLGRYFPNTLAMAMWQKIVEYRAAESLAQGQAMTVDEAGRQWFAHDGHEFLRQWALAQAELPQRVRGEREPGRPQLAWLVSLVTPGMRDVLQAGFRIGDVMLAVGHEVVHDHKGLPYDIDLMAHLTHHAPTSKDEAAFILCDIQTHKWYMSERAGHDVGLRAAALDYFRRLRLAETIEAGVEL